MEDAQAWVDMGIKQAIYHRSRDAKGGSPGVSWTEEDLIKMQKLSDIGIELSITGGIVTTDLHLFKNPVCKIVYCWPSVSCCLMDVTSWKLPYWNR